MVNAQRQAPLGVIVFMLKSFISFLKTFFWPFLFFFIRASRSGVIESLPYFTAGLVIFILYGILDFRNFKFYILNNEFIVESGVFNKKKVSIHLDRIQQVNLSQTFLHRILNLYALSVDTAGSESKEVNIKAIDLATAELLKGQLLSEKKILGESPTEEAEPVFTADTIGLLKVAITSRYRQTMWWAFVFFGGLYKQVRDFFDKEKFNEESISKRVLEAVEASIWISVGVFFLIFFLANLARYLFKYHEFKLKKEGGNLTLNYGFLGKKTTILHPSKIQLTTYSQNYFQKKLGVLEFKIQQISNFQPDSEDKTTINGQNEIPGLSTTKKDEVINLIFGKNPFDGLEKHGANYRMLVMKLLFNVLLPVSILLLLMQVFPAISRNLYTFAAVYVVFMSLASYVSYQNYKVLVGQNFMVVRSGYWDIKHEIIEIHKIQNVEVSQKIWQRKAQIGDLTLHTAGGTLRIRFQDYNLIQKWTNQILYRVETSKKAWM